jgi:predicted RNA-binding protein
MIETDKRPFYLFVESIMILTNYNNNIYMFDLQDELRIFRGAISQIASNLKKRYLVRETDKNNR